MKPSPPMPIETSRRAWLWPVAVFAAGIVLSLLVWWLAADFIGHKERERFDFRISETADAIIDRLEAQRHILRGGAAFFTASEEVSRRRWRVYGESQRLGENFPGLLGFGFSLRLSPAELPEHVRRIQAEGFTNYTIRPAGERAEYTSVIYLEPFDARNQRAFGYDMFSEPVRRAAMEEARDADHTKMSGKVTLVQETDQDAQAGFIMYVPVYRNGLPTGTVAERRAALHGYVFSPFGAKQLLNGIFPGGIPDLHLQIFDGRQTPPESLLYASDDQRGNRLQAQAELTTDKVTELYGHYWTFRFSAKPSFFHPAEHFLPGAVLATAFSLNLLFSLLVSAEGTIREKAGKLAHEITERQQAHTEIHRLNEHLEQRVRERTAELEVANQRLLLSEFSVNHAAVATFWVTPDAHILRVNRAACDMLGYTEAELLALTVADLNPEFQAAAWPAHWQELRERQWMTLQSHYQHKDGHLLPMEIELNWLEFEGRTYSFAFMRDITERQQALAELARHREHLEQLVAERTKDLEVARAAALSLMQDAQRQQQRLAEALVAQRVLDAQLQEANQELESFSYSVSHDLRAPLRHVQGYVEMLVRETQGQLADKPGRYLKTIADASEEMSHLIDDLLAFSRMGRAEMHQVSVPLDELVQETIRSLELVTAGRNITWKIAPLPKVMGDASMLKQLLANLIGNAVKYSRPSDPAHIEIGCAGREDGQIILFVRDNGVGFDMQYAHKLFGVFQRLHQPEEFEGTGIGLAIVRRIIARHGGRIWAEAAVNQGATFYFTLKPAPSESPT